MHLIDSLNPTTTTFLDKINASIKVSSQLCIVKMRQEDEEALEVDKDREDDRQWLVHLGRVWRCFVDLDSFHRTNIFLGIAMGIFFIIGKD